MPLFARKLSTLFWLLPIGFAAGIFTGSNTLVPLLCLQESGSLQKLAISIIAGCLGAPLFYTVGWIVNRRIIFSRGRELEISCSKIIGSLVTKRLPLQPRLEDVLEDPDEVDKCAWKLILDTKGKENR
jgi:H+/gluconate symporter-like permease